MISDKYFRRHGSQAFLSATILKALKKPTVQHLCRYGVNGEFFEFNDEDLVITDPALAIKIERLLARLHPEMKTVRMPDWFIKLTQDRILRVRRINSENKDVRKILDI